MTNVPYGMGGTTHTNSGAWGAAQGSGESDPKALEFCLSEVSHEPGRSCCT